MAAAAQKVYDDWDQNEAGECDEYGCGGICDDIASEIVDILHTAHIEAVSVHDDSENHTYVMAKIPDGIYSVDIPPFTYETGSFYRYRKRPHVIFDECDVLVDRVFADDRHWNEIAND